MQGNEYKEDDTIFQRLAFYILHETPSSVISAILHE